MMSFILRREILRFLKVLLTLSNYLLFVESSSDYYKHKIINPPDYSKEFLKTINDDLADHYLVKIEEKTAMSEREAGIVWSPLTDPKVQGYRVITNK